MSLLASGSVAYPMLRHKIRGEGNDVRDSKIRKEYFFQAA